MNINRHVINHINYIKMKKLLFLLLTMLFLTSAYSQDRKHQLWVGLQTDLNGSSLLYASISPTVLYFINNKVALGGYVNWQKLDGEERGIFSAIGRYYLTGGFFAEGGFSSDFDSNNGYLLGAGVTSFWGSRVYIEPKFGYEYRNDFIDIEGVKLSLGIGIKI